MRKYKIFINGLFLSSLMFFTACEKEKTILPEKEKPTPLTEIQASYKKMLVAETAGWFLSYKPKEQSPEIAIFMRFLETDSLTLLAGYDGFYEERNLGSYGFGGQVSTELQFAKNTLFQQLETDINGALKFKITPQPDGSFALKRADGFDDKAFTLKKATAQDLAVLQSQINVLVQKAAFEKEQLKLKKIAAYKLSLLGADDPGFYFQNLTVGNFSAGWSDLDTLAKKVTLKWKDGIFTKENIFSYTLVANGIALSPKLVSGTIEIDTIKFNNYENHLLDIKSAGNAGAGSWGYHHVPPYDYQTAIEGAPNTYTTADFFIRGELPRFYGYTLDVLDTYYSPELQRHREIFRQAVDANSTHITSSIFRFQFYNYSMNGTGTTALDRLNSIQILTKTQANANVFIPYYYDIEKLGANHVKITFNEGTNSAGTPFLADAKKLFEVLFPEEGLTVVPSRRSISGQLIRLISRKDSRIWVEMLVSTPAGIYFN